MKTKYSIMLAMMMIVVAMVSCEPKPKTENEEHGGWGGLNETEKLVKRHIDELSNVTNWTDAQVKYAKNRNDIDSLIKRTNLKKDLMLLNKKNFCYSMDTIMQIIMGGECEPQHKELRAIHAERAKYADIDSPLHNQVDNTYSNHERLIKLVDGWGSAQIVGSFNDYYNTSHDSNVQETANKELPKAPSCTYIKKYLKNPSLKLSGRHKKFCDDIVRLLEQTSTNPNDANIVWNRIKFYKAKYKEDANYKGWNKRLEDFQNMHEDK